MRIGEVNQENYKQMLKILGVKNPKSLGILSAGGEDWQNQCQSLEARDARMVASGFVEDGMLIREGDTSHRKIVPVSDDIKNKLIEVTRRQFLTNGNGMSPTRDGDEISAIKKEYRKNVPPSERLSVTYTLSQIVQAENRRLTEYVRANVPNWTHGQPIPTDVLKDAVSGNGHLDVKV
jgi:hypothetical protein